ncbi:unnamed protein product [Dicrocoelium dendriticum]|nr:unnamed protein product [Dicrocoelium dendriticum]
MLLLLCPKILEEIINADNGAPLSPQHQKKKQFMDEVRKALACHGHSVGSSKPTLTEAALLAAVNLCKASTYININDRDNIFFIFVHSVYADLQNILFNPSKTFIRTSQNVAETEALLTEFFVASFRITPHNKNLLKVCLQQNSSAIHHTVLISALYRIITQPRLPWWPDVSPFYSKSTEIRTMFLETLNKVNHHPPIRIAQSLNFRDRMSLKNKDKAEDSLMSKYNLLLNMVRLINANPLLVLYCPQTRPSSDAQKATFELMNGLMSLIQQSTMSDLAQEAMDALLCLHQPANIRLWNLHSPAQAFWEISPQLLYSIAQKLVNRNIPNSCDVLKWLREILLCRINFLQQNCDYINLSGMTNGRGAEDNVIIDSNMNSLECATTKVNCQIPRAVTTSSSNSQWCKVPPSCGVYTEYSMSDHASASQQSTFSGPNPLLGPLGVNSKRNRMALIKLETVFFTYLWSLDLEAVLTSMSCFRLLCQEAELWSNAAAAAMVATVSDAERNAVLCPYRCSSVYPDTYSSKSDASDREPDILHSSMSSGATPADGAASEPKHFGPYIHAGSSALAADMLCSSQPHSSLNPTLKSFSGTSDSRNRTAGSGLCIALCNCGCPLCTPTSYLLHCATTVIPTFASASQRDMTNSKHTSAQHPASCSTEWERKPHSCISPAHVRGFCSLSNSSPWSWATSCAFSDCQLPDILPLYSVYAEIADHSRSIITTGRAHLQKQLLNLLRKVNYQTQGNKLAWEHTYMIWLRSTKFLINYPKSKTASASGSAEESCCEGSASHSPSCANMSTLSASVGHGSGIKDSISATGEFGSTVGSGDAVCSGNTIIPGSSSASLGTTMTSLLTGSGVESSSVNSACATTGFTGVNSLVSARYLSIKRRTSQHSLATDHELEDVLNEWANMTGFLCALGSVALNPPASQPVPSNNPCHCGRRFFGKRGFPGSYQMDAHPPAWNVMTLNQRPVTVSRHSSLNDSSTKSYSRSSPCLPDECTRRDSQSIASSTSHTSSAHRHLHPSAFDLSLNTNTETNITQDPHSCGNSNHATHSQQAVSCSDSLDRASDYEQLSLASRCPQCSHWRVCMHHPHHHLHADDGPPPYATRGPFERGSSNQAHSTASTVTGLTIEPSVRNAVPKVSSGPISSCSLHSDCSADVSGRHSSSGHATGLGQDSRFSPVAQYIGNLLLLISCQHEKFGHQIQKHVKEAIGNELNPLVYPILFNQLRAHVDACFSGQGQQQVVVTETNTLFIENVIFIMRSILEKHVHKTVGQCSSYLEEVSIETLTLNIVRYVRHLECVHSLQIKVKVCQLVQKMMARREDLNFRQVNFFAFMYSLIFT